MQVNIHSSRKVEGETRGVESGHRRGETGSWPRMKLLISACLLLEPRTGTSPNSLVRTSILHLNGTGLSDRSRSLFIWYSWNGLADPNLGLCTPATKGVPKHCSFEPWFWAMGSLSQSSYSFRHRQAEFFWTVHLKLRGGATANMRKHPGFLSGYWQHLP